MTKSRVFIFLLLSFILGVLFYSIIKIPLAAARGILIAGFFILVLGFFKKDRQKIIAGLCILMLTFGIWRSHKVFSNGSSETVKNFIGSQDANFEGVIVGEPDRRLNFSQYIVKNNDLGRVLIKTNLYPEYFYGDVLKVSGKIEEPEIYFKDSNFNYKIYLAKENIFLVSQYPNLTLVKQPKSSNFYGSLLMIKRRFIEIIDKILPEPKASFLSALLVGARRALPSDLVNAFNITGTSHIVAISGYNISIISIMLLNFLSYLFLPRRLIFWIVIVCLIAFTLVSGASASVIRAAIMGGLLVLAGREGRFYQVTNAMIFSGAVMLFFNPYLLRYDTGFKLSFLAAFGLIYLAPRFNTWLSSLPNFLSFRNNLSATLSAQIMTFPIIFWEFGRISLVATLTNVLILPAIPVTMLFGFLAGLVGFISLKVAGILVLPAWLLLSYQIFVVKMLSALPWVSI